MNTYFSKRLHHNTPSWVADMAIYHMRIRRSAQSDKSLIDAGNQLIDSVIFYSNQHTWSCYLFLLMPDHMHALLSFGLDRGMTAAIRDWKRYQKLKHGVEWQDGYFDHRIRSHQEYTKTYHYILNNPVVLGLCKSPDDWPWKITAMHPEAVPHF